MGVKRRLVCSYGIDSNGEGEKEIGLGTAVVSEWVIGQLVEESARKVVREVSLPSAPGEGSLGTPATYGCDPRAEGPPGPVIVATRRTIRRVARSGFCSSAAEHGVRRDGRSIAPALLFSSRPSSALGSGVLAGAQMWPEKRGSRAWLNAHASLPGPRRRHDPRPTGTTLELVGFNVSAAALREGGARIEGEQEWLARRRGKDRQRVEASHEAAPLRRPKAPTPAFSPGPAA